MSVQQAMSCSPVEMFREMRGFIADTLAAAKALTDRPDNSGPMKGIEMTASAQNNASPITPQQP